MEEEKRPEWGNAQQNKETKNNFIIKYIIFVIILVLITVVGIYFTIKQIDKSMKDVSEQSDLTIEKNEEVEETKKLAKDSKYAINSYSETYNTNPIKIRKYKDIDGEVIEETQETRKQIGINPQDFKYNINFIQIDGLKDKVVQNKINTKLKSVPYTLEKEKHVWTNVTANFSNVLSVVISNDISYEDDAKTLNFDLTTGEDISFEDLFVSSAPIKSILASAMYEQFAWDKLSEISAELQEPVDLYDMGDADTSEIEDQILVAVKKYDMIKDKIRFSFSSSDIDIYNEELKSRIDMIEFANEIAIYKRYLTEESIFANDNKNKVDLIVFSNDIVEIVGENNAKTISYEKILDNIFVQEVLFEWAELNFEEMELITKYVENLSKEQKNILKQQIASDKGMIFQGEYTVIKDEEEGYYSIGAQYYKAECTLSYFKDEAFKDYAKVTQKERADVGLNAFSTYMQKEFPEMQIFEAEYKTYYLSPTGEFLGNTIEEVESKVWE